MVSITQTKTKTSNGHSAGTLKLRSPTTAPTQSSNVNTLAAPIELSGAFKRRGIAHSPSTPAIGEEFQENTLDLVKLLEEDDDELLRELTAMVAHRGVVFVRGQHNLTQQHMNKLALKFGQHSGRPSSSKLHIHPLSKEFSESGEFLGEKIDSERDETGRQISFADEEKSTRASAGWHTDISFEPIPSDFAMLQLKVVPEVGGDTMWSSMYSAYDTLSKPMQQFLEGLTATHDADMFRDQANRYGFSLYEGPRGHPENVGGRLRASHPIVRTNPITGYKGLYINKSFTKRINELNIDESNNMLEYLFRHIDSNFNWQVRFRWQVNDIAIWSNVSTQHSGIFDFGKEKRTGNRVCSLGEKPFFDSVNSKSRKEDLASKGRLY